MTKKLTNQQIRRIRRLAKTMRLKDVAKTTGYGRSSVERYAKGIRQQMNVPRIKRPKHPCPSCSSIRVVSQGKKEWQCKVCGRYWRKNPKFLRVSLREHNQMIQLKKRGLSYSQIAKILKRSRRVVIDHSLGRIVPSS